MSRRFQIKYVITSACSWFARGSLSGWTCPEHLHREDAGSHPVQMQLKKQRGFPSHVNAIQSLLWIRIWNFITTSISVVLFIQRYSQSVNGLKLTWATFIGTSIQVCSPWIFLIFHPSLSLAISLYIFVCLYTSLWWLRSPSQQSHLISLPDFLIDHQHLSSYPLFSPCPSVSPSPQHIALIYKSPDLFFLNSSQTVCFPLLSNPHSTYHDT